MVSALGICGSFTSGIIEYLAEGSWTKRVHPGWSANSGMNATLMAKSDFLAQEQYLKVNMVFLKHLH